MVICPSIRPGIGQPCRLGPQADTWSDTWIDDQPRTSSSVCVISYHMYVCIYIIVYKHVYKYCIHVSKPFSGNICISVHIVV